MSDEGRPGLRAGDNSGESLNGAPCSQETILAHDSAASATGAPITCGNGLANTGNMILGANAVPAECNGFPFINESGTVPAGTTGASCKVAWNCRTDQFPVRR